MPTPLVAVVGRPNVGKSTLFNRLVGKRIAIVDDTPGITRDRLYAPVEWLGRSFTLIDTGGIVFDELDPLIVQVHQQAEIAMDEADAILFMVDAQDGLTSADYDMANALRAAKAPVFLVANKVDSNRLQQDSMEFYALGIGQVYPVSSVHGHGLGDLLDDVMDRLPRTPDEDENEDQTRLAIIGRPNVGKSSLVNAVLGEDRVIVSPIPGTTRDAIDTAVRWDERDLLLIDTAGIRRAGKIQGSIEYYTVLRAKTAIDRCHVGVIVLDASVGLMDGDKRVAGMSDDAGRGCILVANKWDLVDPGILHGRRPDRDAMLAFTDTVRREMPFLSYAPLVFCSAKAKFSIPAVIETALLAAESHAHRIPTGELTRLMRDAAEAHPRIEHGREMRIYYSTMPRVQPPTVVLFLNDPELMHFSYERYLENRLRERYPLEGTPVVIRARKAGEKERDEGKQ